MDEFLIGVRLRPGQSAGDYRVAEAEPVLGEVRRPRRPVPEARRDTPYRHVLRLATEREVSDHRALALREREAAATVQQFARTRGLAMKIVDVEIAARARRVVVSFNAEERVDFRDLVRDLAREFHARIEMRQIGARDTTKLMDGIGPCGRQLCCSSYLKGFDPISVKMAKAQDMPLTDSRLLGNCGRLKCCLLYEFSTYEELRHRLPKVGSSCQAECGGSGCMTGRVKSLRVLKQAVLVGFQDGTEAEVPLEQVTWEGRAHIKPK